MQLLVLYFTISIVSEGAFGLNNENSGIPRKTVKANETNHGSVNSSTPIIYDFPVNNTRDSTRISLKVTMSETSRKEVLSKPFLHVSVLQPTDALSSPIKLPMEFKEGNMTFYSAERTLCSLSYDNSTGFTLVFSTNSPTDIMFSFVFHQTEDLFITELDKPMHFNITPTSPIVLGYNFTSNIDNVLLLLESSDKDKDPYCKTVSIQQYMCSIFDQVDNIEYIGKWQTVETSGAIRIKRANVKDNKFLIVIVAHQNHDRCSDRDPFSHPHRNENFAVAADPIQSKTLSLTISNKQYGNMSVGKLILCMAIPILITVLIISMAWLPLKYKRPVSSQFDKSNEIASPRESFTDRDPIIIPVRPDGCCVVANCKFSKIAVTDEREGKWYAKAGSISACFYAVPVFQFAAFYYRVSLQVGDLDMCYYNQRCSHSHFTMKDFNHFWSNIPYIIYGITFIFIVRWRRRSYDGDNGNNDSDCSHPNSDNGNNESDIESLNNEKDNSPHICENTNGLQPPYWTMQALGVSLIMEGCLSAAYHLCPNQYTFQFDTCFMLIIAIILLLHLHHRRHPVLIKAIDTYVILICFMMLPVATLLVEIAISSHSQLIFYFLLFPQIVITVVVSFVYCLVGYIMENDMNTNGASERTNQNKAVTGWALIKYIGYPSNWKIKWDKLCKVPKHRFILPILWLVTTIVVVSEKFTMNLDYIDYVLYTLVALAIITLGHYFSMKLWHREFKQYSWVYPSIYLLFSLALGIWSVTNFVEAANRPNLSPAESRNFNKDCKSWLKPMDFLPPFYDTHDMWHFLSAAALFLAFMGLLVLDEDLINSGKKDIAVF